MLPGHTVLPVVRLPFMRSEGARHVFGVRMLASLLLEGGPGGRIRRTLIRGFSAFEREANESLLSCFHQRGTVCVIQDTSGKCVWFFPVPAASLNARVDE